jgi:RNA polymerase sigma-70 factor, ECF subfamily
VPSEETKTPGRAAGEEAIRAAWEEADFEEAATRAIRAYGPEILGFLVARLRDEDEAGEVFSLFCEDLWRGLPAFAWRATVRVWAYALARNAAARFSKGKGRLRQREVPLARVGRLSQIAGQVRASTLAYLRTQVKSRMRQLYEQLPEEDQTVLTLRIDKQLSFREIAQILLGGEGDGADEAALKREAARVRKRFQLAKDQLRRLAETEGLLE